MATLDIPDRYEELVAEIDRIVNSPYTTQLKHLRDIVYSRCSVVDISRWARSMPCQVDRLVSEVVEGLRHWPYVLDIVERLSTGRDVRDALLRNEPSLLRDIIVQAAKSADVCSKYTAVAAVMLSHSLPKNVSLPTEIQTIFVRSFEQAAENPSVETIKPIYEILQGTSDMLLSLLSSSVLLRFEAQLFSILKNVKGDNQSLCLYCLAIMNVLSTSSDERTAFLSESYDTQELLASTHITPSRWTADAIKQFFSGSKAQKTMQLTVLRSMWACTTTTGEPLNERIESLRLANQIITAVPENDRETWRKANALIVRKLEEKILASALETPLRFESICFLLRLTEGHVFPATALDLLRQTLAKDPAADILCYGNNESDILYVIRCGAFDQNTATSLLQNIVDFITTAAPQSILTRAKSITTLLKGLAQVLPEREELVEGAMLALDVLSCGRKLQDLAKLCQRSPSLQSTDIEVCDHAVSCATNELVHGLCKSFLTASILSRQSTYSVSYKTTSLILDLHAASSQALRPCAHVTIRESASKPALVFAEAACTQDVRPSNWRDALQSHLHLRNASDQADLAALFARSCAKLEARCDIIEQPLQEQKAKSEALEQRYNELTEAHAQLEAQSIDHGIQFNAMEMERDQCLTDLETAREEIDELQRRATEQGASIEQIKANANESVAAVRRELEMAELHHATIVTRMEEELEQVSQEKLELERDLEQIKTDLETAQTGLQSLGSVKLALESEFETTKASLEGLREAHNSLEQGNANLIRRQEELEEQVQATRQDANVAQQAHKSELAQQQKEAADERASVQEASDARMLRLTEQHDNLKAELETKIQGLVQQHQSLEEGHNSKLENLQHDIDEKQRRIEKLKNRCEQKDKQIAEANAMRSNLMAAMGINGNASKQTKLPHRPAASFGISSQSQDMGEEDPSPPTPFSEHDDVAQQTSIGASFTSSTDSRSGPTPKRARPRRTIKVASPARPRMSAAPIARTTRKSVATTTNAAKVSTDLRQPLSSVSANQSQRKTSNAKTPTPSKTVEQVVDPMDESTFDGSELFTGTQGQRMLGIDHDLQYR